LDRVPTAWTAAAAFASGLVTFPLLLVTFNKCLSNCKAVTGRLTSGSVLEVAVLLVSSVFAILTCTVALTVISSYRSSVIYDSHPLIRHWLVVGVSYFAYDLVAMYAVFKTGTAATAPQAGWTDFLAARPLIIVHHLVIPLIVVPFFFMVGAVRGDYLIAAFVLMEASTPFVSARRILEILGQKSTVIYAVNGVAMTVMFFLCRLANIWFIYHTYAIEIGMPLFQAVIQKVPTKCNACTLLVTCLQLYWWLLMVRGCLKFIKSKKQGKKSD